MSSHATAIGAIGRRAQWVHSGWWCIIASMLWTSVEGGLSLWAGEVAVLVPLIIKEGRAA